MAKCEMLRVDLAMLYGVGKEDGQTASGTLHVNLRHPVHGVMWTRNLVGKSLSKYRQEWQLPPSIVAMKSELQLEMKPTAGTIFMAAASYI